MVINGQIAIHFETNKQVGFKLKSENFSDFFFFKLFLFLLNYILSQCCHLSFYLKGPRISNCDIWSRF